ncbi:MAG: hypothetical protein R6T90_09605 [Dissulfuribacterales bacterium]
MMDEIAALKAALNPQETLFVVDAMTGQDAVNTAKAAPDTKPFLKFMDFPSNGSFPVLGL